jgi:hypothetical protein
MAGDGMARIVPTEFRHPMDWARIVPDLIVTIDESAKTRLCCACPALRKACAITPCTNNGGAWELPRGTAGPRGVNHAMLVEAMQRALGVGFAKADSLVTGMAVKRGISLEDARKVWSEAGDVKADSLMAEMDAGE